MADRSHAARPGVVVVYALPEEQHLIDIPWQPGMTAAQAVARSGLAQKFADIETGSMVLAIYGRRVTAQHRIDPGDRVEICRPLQRDPRELRRLVTASGGVVGMRGEKPEKN